MIGLPGKRWGCSLLAALALFSCSFDDDRSLGSLGTTAPRTDATGGASSSGGQTFALGSAPAGGTPMASTASLGPGCGSDPSLCSEGEYCETGLDCMRTKLPPTCVARPAECPEPTGRETTCGCNGLLYESACLAKRAGTAVGDYGYCEAIACQDVLDCIGIGDTCAALYGATAPAPICNESRCDCQRPTVIQ